MGRWMGWPGQGVNAVFTRVSTAKGLTTRQLPEQGNLLPDRAIPSTTTTRQKQR